MNKIIRILFSLILFSAASSLAQEKDEIYDPWEGYNRAIFDFNDALDINLAEPVATGWDYVLPKRLITGIENAFYNIQYPSRFVSDVVQLKFEQAAVHTGRFLINSTIGLLGLIDVAEEIGLEKHDEDFGTALAYWGVGPGPYTVLPLLGPKNTRDTFGYCVDLVLNPLFWIPYLSFAEDSWKLWHSVAVSTIDVVNTRAELLDVIETAKESALDYYLFTQSAYYQYRNGVIFDGNPPGQGDDWLEADDDLYDEQDTSMYDEMDDVDEIEDDL